MPDVFISYSRKNKDFVRKLVDPLIVANKDIWVDWEDIPLSAPNWWMEIKKGIESADSFIFVMSQDSLESLVCHLELDYALEQGKRVIPLLYQPYDEDSARISITQIAIKDDMRERFGEVKPLDMATHNLHQLSHINWIVYDQTNAIDATVRQLIETVETDLDYVKQHTRYLIHAEEWIASGRSNDLLLFGKEIKQAEAWLERGQAFANQHQQDKVVAIVNPLPVEQQYRYIHQSREAQNRRTWVARGVALSVIMLALALGVGGVVANNLVQDTQREVNARTQELIAINQQIADRTAELNRQFAGIAPTISDVEIARAYCVSGILTELVERPTVIELCDRMVELAPSVHRRFYGDIRAIARAQTGDVEGAIDDFSSAVSYYGRFAANCTSIIALRNQWIAELESGNNPFLTEGELDMGTAIQDWLSEPSLNECDT